MIRTTLVTLGKFELWVENRLAPALPTQKARALVVFLVSNRGMDVARERLLELFWSEFEPERAREGLRTALSSIRHALRSVHGNPDELVSADKSVVRWLAATEYDAARFEELARSKDIADKRAALKMYGGDLLEGTYEEWVVRERDRIATLYESVLADLVAQTHDVVAAHLLLTRNPFHEQAYVTLIDAQVQANRPAAAAELVAQYRAALREMKTEPSSDFQRRFAHLQALNTLAPAARRVERANLTRAFVKKSETNLPTQLTSFVGREDDLHELQRLLATSRLVTLVGAGGIGKTRLAIETAGAARELFDDGVWFVDLATVSDSNYIAAAIAAVLGVSTSTLDRSVQDTLILAIQQRSMLLVLDNCEHLIPNVVSVVELLLRGCPRISILATAREPLSAEGESVVRLSALPEKDAIALFDQRARAADKRFAMTDRNEPIVRAICQRLDGIPLAIELAAPRVTFLSVKHLHAELDEHFRILTTGSSTVLPRHKTVRALIDWSYNLLTPAEQTLLRYIGVFVGGFTLEAAEAAFDEALPECPVIDLISSLTAKSLLLVEADADRERYRLLQITQQYAVDKLRESGELSAMRARHAQYFLRLMQEADESYGVTNAREWLQRYRFEMQNVRAAINFCFETDDVQTAAALIAASRELGQELGLYAEGIHLARRALQRLGEDAPLGLRGGLWLVIAQHANTLYLTTEALDAGRRASEAFEALDDELHLPYAWQSVAFSLMRAGAHNDAEVAMQKAQTLAERQGNRRVMMRVLLRRAQNIYEGRSPLQALPLYQRDLQLARTIEADQYEGYILGQMAEVYFVLSDPAQSIACANAARVIFERRNDAAMESSTLVNLAAYQLAVGDLAEAKNAARAAFTRARESESYVSVLAAVHHLAAVAAVEGQVQIPAQLIGFSSSGFTRLGFTPEHTEKYARDRATQALKEKLDDEQLQALLIEGSGLTEDEAFGLAMHIGGPQPNATVT